MMGLMDEGARSRILRPLSGSALARARDFGLDLTLIARNVGLSVEARLDKAERALRLARSLQEMREANHR